MLWNALNQRCSIGVMQYFLWWRNSWPRWRVADLITLVMVPFWPLSPWRRSHWCSHSTFHLAYLHRLNHGCRDELISCLGTLASPKFLFLRPSLSGLTVRRWSMPGSHMLVWISEVIRIWYCRLESSGVSWVIFFWPYLCSLLFIMFLYSYDQD